MKREAKPGVRRKMTQPWTVWPSNLVSNPSGREGLVVLTKAKRPKKESCSTKLPKAKKDEKRGVG